MQKIVQCIELIIMETDFVSHIRHQNGDVSCGWRVCFNAILLVKIVLEIEVLFYLFNQSKVSFNIIDMTRALKGIFYMQIPFDISTYSNLDLDKFRVKWSPMLVITICDCAKKRAEDGACLGTVTWLVVKKRREVQSTSTRVQFGQRKICLSF